MEKALKGMLAAKGISHSGLTGHKHNNLHSFLTLIRKILEPDFILSAVKRFVDPSIFEHLERMERLAADINRGRRQKRDPEADTLRAEVATWPAEAVELLLTTLERIESVLVVTTKKPVKLGAPPPEGDGDLFDWMWNRIMTQVFSRIPRSQWPKIPDDHIKAAKDLFRGLFDSVGESRIRAELSEANEWNVGPHFQWVFAYMTVYIIGTIAWPHAVWARYPAPPESPDDAFEAAKVGKMGTRHYSDRIGAMVHLEALASRAEQATRTLIKCHQAGIGIFSNPDIQTHEDSPGNGSGQDGVRLA